jgi:hypothetical protein
MFGLLITNIWIGGQAKIIPDMIVADDIPDHVVHMVHHINECQMIDDEYIQPVVQSLEAALAAHACPQSQGADPLPQLQPGPSNRVAKYVTPNDFHIQT